MRKFYLLRCWSSNEHFNGDFDAALIEVGPILREKAWNIRKNCQRFIDAARENKRIVAASLEVSFFSSDPFFFNESLFELCELLDREDSVRIYEDIEDIDDIEEKALWGEGCRVHACADGLYWSTYPKNADVRITTATLTWKELGIG